MPIREFINRKLWRWPYRHMRSFSLDSRLEPTACGGWTILHESNVVATTVPLLEWLGAIDRPVTIVAGGPSARDHSFDECHDGKRLIVAVNGVPAFLAERKIRPDAWIVSDPRLAEQVEANFPNAVGIPLAITARAVVSLARTSPIELASRRLCIIERVNQWHGVASLSESELIDLNKQSGSPFHFPETGPRKSIVGWSWRPEMGFFSGSTVVFAALQLLVRLGAKDIEIVGMDLSGQGHAYDDGKGSLPNTLADDYEISIRPSFELMHQVLEKTGVLVKNLSPVCPLRQRVFGS
jgi:hypothetical protein